MRRRSLASGWVTLQLFPPGYVTVAGWRERSDRLGPASRRARGAKPAKPAPHAAFVASRAKSWGLRTGAYLGQWD